VVPATAAIATAGAATATAGAATAAASAPTVVPAAAATATAGAATGATATGTFPYFTWPVASSNFVKLGTTGDIFYVEEKAGQETMHKVQNGCGAWSCQDVPISQCQDATVVDQAFIDQRAQGQAFVCEMLAMAVSTTSSPGAVQAVASSASSRETPSQSDGGSPTEQEQSSGSWPLLLLGIAVVLCLCACCNYGLWYYYIPIIRRFPWLDGYLPFQWGFTTSNTFTKLRDGYATTREEELSRDSEAQFPLMFPSDSRYGGPGMPPMMPATQEQFGQGRAMMPQEQIPPLSNQPGMMLADQGYDLVTVTPNGLQVTPLGGAAVPQGVPIVNPLASTGQGSIVNPSLRSGFR